jgi:FtsZ-interacting cell division protein ZipA
MEWTSIVLIVISGILALVTLVFGTQWSKIKAKLEQFKQFVVLVVDAAADDKVTEDEFKGIVDAGKKLLGM